MTNQQSILIIEDEASIADNIVFALKAEGYHCEWVSLGKDAIERVRQGGIDLVILDVGLPDQSGFEVCKAIRIFSEIPIIFVTARSDEIDRVVGLEIGADDYVTKPFSPRELAARVKARLRRAQSSGEELVADTLFKVDDEKKQIHFSGSVLNLTFYEYGILKHLLASPERVFSREQLMDAVWEMPEVALDRSVDTHVKALRAKLKEVNAAVSPIKTHRGMGYSISVR